MMRADVGNKWVAIDVQTSVVMPVWSDTRVRFRSEAKARVYAAFEEDFSDEQLVAVFEGELEVCCRRGDPNRLRIATDGRVWACYTSLEQVAVRQSDEIFTTLDRPAPMSPEMRAVHEMMRRNEIERERMREMMEREHNERLQRVERALADRTARASDEEKPKAGKPRGSKSQKPESDEGRKAVPERDELEDDELEERSERRRDRKSREKGPERA